MQFAQVFRTMTKLIALFYGTFFKLKLYQFIQNINHLGDLDGVERLLESGADAKLANFNNMTALYYATMFGKMCICYAI